ncbi:phage distal tail protein [Streptomyces boncukensis]|uniref:Phage tail protein n=1 Tax=Streptomyces boncukensis TaxID=2711219 RepID=A0A6G4X0R8_9ACTN|nr:phage tail domain-containing protein [Streptomyces boncukensis]NGO71136.1 phage tail protein [Streptomyces boncukensis]
MIVSSGQQKTQQKRNSPGSLIARDGQIQWAGLLFGPGTPYQVDVKGITGWDDLPGFDTGDVSRPDQHGAWAGARWAQPRTVAATVWLLPDTAADARATLRGFRTETSPEGGEQWLAVRLHGETLACLARVSRRVVPQDRDYAVHGTARAALQWVATDPRRYGVEQRTARTRLPAPEPGLRWEGEPGGLGWPLDWGEGGTAGSLTAVNSGAALAHPEIEFRGPVRRPELTRLTDGLRLGYDLTLAEGETLTVDTRAGTVVLNGTASRLYTAAADSSPEQLFQLEPGANPLVFRSADAVPDPAASVTVRWRDAHW